MAKMIKHPANVDYGPAQRLKSAIGGIKKILSNHTQLQKQEIIMRLESIIGMLEPKDDPKLIEKRLSEGWESSPDYLTIQDKETYLKAQNHFKEKLKPYLDEENISLFLKACILYKNQNPVRLKKPLIIKCRNAELYTIMQEFYLDFYFEFENQKFRWIIVKIFYKSFLKLQSQKYSTIYSNMQKSSGKTLKHSLNSRTSK